MDKYTLPKQKAKKLLKQKPKKLLSVNPREDLQIPGMGAGPKPMAPKPAKMDAQRGLPIGTRKIWGGIEYEKKPEGWKPVPKGEKEAKKPEAEKPVAEKEKAPEAKPLINLKDMFGSLREHIKGPSSVPKEKIHPEVPANLTKVNDAINIALNEIDKLPPSEDTRKMWVDLMTTKIEMAKQSRDTTEDARIKGEAQKILQQDAETVAMKQQGETKTKEKLEHEETLQSYDKMRDYLTKVSDKEKAGQELTPPEERRLAAYQKELGKHEKRLLKDATIAEEAEQAQKAEEAQEKSKAFVNEFAKQPPKPIQPTEGFMDTDELPDFTIKQAGVVDRELENHVGKILGEIYNRSDFKITGISTGQRAFTVFVDLEEGVDESAMKQFNDKTRLKAEISSTPDGKFALQFFNDGISSRLGIKLPSVNSIGLKRIIQNMQKQMVEYQKKTGNRGLFVPLGNDAEGNPTYVNMAEDNINSISDVGDTGSSKTYTIENGILALAANYTPEEVQMDLIDGGTGSAFAFADDIKAFLVDEPLRGISSEEGINNLLKRLDNNIQEAYKRQAIMNKLKVKNVTELGKLGKQLPMRYVVIDELQALFTNVDNLYAGKQAEAVKKKIFSKVAYLKRLGRKYGIKTHLAAQNLLTAEKNYKYLKALLAPSDVRRMYRADESTARNFMGKPSLANKNAPQGFGYVESADRAPMYIDSPSRELKDDKGVSDEDKILNSIRSSKPKTSPLPKEYKAPKTEA